MNELHVPFVDLAAQTAEIAAEVAEGFREVVGTNAFISGPAVRAFEQSYAAYLGVGHCIGVGNGTDALELAFRGAGLRAGDEVLVPANTFVATAAAVVRLGAVPVLVDVDPEHLLIDPERAAGAVTARTRAIAAVHLYGQAAPMDDLRAIAAEHGLVLVEDAAQAQGARQDGRAAGSLGAVAATSFYPGKNLGAFGDAGAVLTDDDAVADRVRHLGDHGSRVKYRHEIVGWNSRLDSLQAVVLSAKLARLDAWNAARRAAAERYAALLGDCEEVRLPATRPGNLHVWHLYVVRVPDRERAIAALRAAGVEAGIHYPVPVHLQPAFARDAGGPGSFPVAEEAAGQILSLPMHPHLTERQQEHVAAVLRAAVATARAAR